MILNKVEFEKLLNEKFEKNYTRCSEALNINVSTISRIMSNENKPGTKFFTNLVNYCNKNNLNYNNFILFR